MIIFMIKKLLIIILCALMALSLFAGCGILNTGAQLGQEQSEQANNSESSAQSETAQNSTPQEQDAEQDGEPEPETEQTQSFRVSATDDVIELICSCFTGGSLRIPQGEGEELIEPALTTSLADIKEKGSLVIGIDESFAPFTFKDENGNYTGFDIDLATAVCNQLGVTPEFVPIHWLHKETLLNSGAIDCIWSGLSFTNERQEDMGLTGAYFRNILTVKTAEGISVSSEEDLVGLRIGVQVASAAYNALLYSSVYAKVEEDLMLYNDYEQVLDDMQSGALDCIIVDEHFYNYKVQQEGLTLGSSPMDFGDDFYVIATRKSDTELNMQINAAITELRLSGVLSELSLEWFGTDFYVV